MPESTFTIRVDDHLKEAFTEAARVSDRTGAQLIRDFMREYVQTAREKAEYEEWFKAKVEAGLRPSRKAGFFPTKRFANVPDSGASACLRPMRREPNASRLVRTRRARS